ncbi:MAG: hypothetical protein CW338_01160 [Clostridiales bacterium]|nr:hypothetical protein [Clostridiales bacterium]
MTENGPSFFEASSQGECDRLRVEMVFVNNRGEVLLQKRPARKGQKTGTWCLPGGNAKKGESGEDACVREAEEQLGLVPDLSHSRVLIHKVEQGMLRDIVLLYQDADEKEIRFNSDKVLECRWVQPEDIRTDETYSHDMEKIPGWGSAFPFIRLESMRKRIPLGHYKHYKGNEYLVKGLALHSETMDPMVIYQAMYGPGEIWVRPATMWIESVSKLGYEGPRFTILDTDEE